MTTALAPGVSPEALAPGDPEGARALAARLEGYAEGAGAAAARLRVLESGTWVGEAAEAFRANLDELPQRLSRATASFAEAASALRAYATAAEEARQRAALTLVRRRPGRRRLGRPSSPSSRPSTRRLRTSERALELPSTRPRLPSSPPTACGASLPPDAFVFSHEPDGSVPWKPGYVSLKFRRLRHSVGLDQVRLHDLRHFVAPACSAPGSTSRPSPAASACRWRRTTLAVYSHFQ